MVNCSGRQYRRPQTNTNKMKIKLTAAQVHDIILAHVQANCPGMEIHPGQVDMFYGRDQYEEPMFDGFSFSFAPKKSKYEEIKNLIANELPRDNRIYSIKTVRNLSRSFTLEEKKTFPVVNGYSGYKYSPMDAADVFGLAYTKFLLENIWAATPAPCPF